MKKSIFRNFITLFMFVIAGNTAQSQCTNCFQNLSITTSGCSALISWTAAGQDATLHHFSIQRSEDNGTNYYEIGTLSVIAGSTANYTFTDGNPPMAGFPPSYNTYRVMAVRANGTGSLSSSTTLTFFCSPIPPTIFPCSNSPVIDAPSNLTTCSGTQYISVINATPQTTTWSSSNPSVLQVASSGFSHGVVLLPTGGTGTATITATQPWCGRTITKTIAVTNCPACTLTCTPVSAFRGCNGSPTCPYENFNWNGATGASLYSIEFTVLNPSLGQTRPTKYFETVGGVISGNLIGSTYYPREILSGSGWVIIFRVRAKCSSSGQWGNYSSWSQQFVY